MTRRDSRRRRRPRPGPRRARGRPRAAPAGRPPGGDRRPDPVADAARRRVVLPRGRRRASPSRSRPLTARTRAERDLVALVFSGLVRIGPAGTLVPDLAERGRSTRRGTTWTFHLRDDAAGRTACRSPRTTSLFTIGALKDPSYRGPGAGVVGRGHGRRRSTPRTVTFTLGDAARRLPRRRPPSRSLPAHLLADVPSRTSPDDSVRPPAGRHRARSR